MFTGIITDIGEVLEIDLSRQSERPRIQYDAELEGYPVWLFSDMKRHDLGDRNAARIGF